MNKQPETFEPRRLYLDTHRWKCLFSMMCIAKYAFSFLNTLKWKRNYDDQTDNSGEMFKNKLDGNFLVKSFFKMLKSFWSAIAVGVNKLLAGRNSSVAKRNALTFKRLFSVKKNIRSNFNQFVLAVCVTYFQDIFSWLFIWSSLLGFISEYKKTKLIAKFAV